MLWRADHHQGWANSDVHLTPITRAYPDDPNGPDELLPEAPKTWPETRVVPFHYPHPVTGKRGASSRCSRAVRTAPRLHRDRSRDPTATPAYARPRGWHALCFDDKR